MATARELRALESDELMALWTDIAKQIDTLRADATRCRAEFERRGISVGQTHVKADPEATE